MPLTLPYPPRVNHYWRRVGPQTLISREGRTFRRNVCALLGGGGPRKPPTCGRIALAMDAFPPDRRRRDLDNIQKPVLDALEHAGVYADDSQIDLEHPERSGVTDALRRLRCVPGVSVIRLSHADIVRHPLVQDIVTAYAAREG